MNSIKLIMLRGHLSLVSDVYFVNVY